jgi:hypothetical protein
VLVELSVMEQRYQAVLAVVQGGWKVVEVAPSPGGCDRVMADRPTEDYSDDRPLLVTPHRR